MNTQAASPTACGSLDGPWTLAFWAEPPLSIRSKSNFRRHRHQEQGAWGALSSFEAQAAMLLRPAIPAGWELGDANDPVADRPKVVAVIAARTLLDVSNLSKSLLDALQGELYVADSQVAAEVSMEERGRNDQWMSVAFAQLDPHSTLGDVAAATAALVCAWSDACPHRVRR